MSDACCPTESAWPGHLSQEEDQDAQDTQDAQEVHDEGRDRPRKRARYITRACNECKRRKIKCNGQNPCRGCCQRKSKCEYMPFSTRNAKHDKHSTEKDIRRLYGHIDSLQKQVSSLAAALNLPTDVNATQSIPPNEPKQSIQQLVIPTFHNAVESQSARTDASPKWSFSSSQKSGFQGPITSAFSLKIAKSNLKSRGITEVDDGDGENVTQEPSPAASPFASGSQSAHASPELDADPLSAISKDEATRLCHVYEEEMGIMYPILSLDESLHLVELVYTHYTRSSASGEAKASQSNIDGAHSKDNNEAVLKLALACGLTAEGGGRSELGLRLFNSVADTAKEYMWRPANMSNIRLLMLLSIFYFQMDEETLAWRLIGTVERMCLELGLHRHETLREPAVVEFGPERASKLFWSVYVLDMRWSLGTGMRCALHEIDIDPKLPEPDESTPYLRVMVDYTRLATKVWNFVAAFNNTNQIKDDEMAWLDWQVLQWEKSIPESLLLTQQPDTQTGDAPCRAILRLQSLLYFRTRQLRILLYRPILHSATQMAQHPNETEAVVNVAIDVIQHLTRLDATSDFYRLQQVAFNWFLVSALAVLFLAVAQAPAEYSGRCKTEFIMAIDLVKSLATKSYASKRLWRSIRSLSTLAAQVGMEKGKKLDNSKSAMQSGNDPAMVPAFDVLQWPDQDQAMDPLAHGMQMSQELMDWFEGVHTMQETTSAVGEQAGLSWEDYQSYSYGEGLSTIMRDCF